MPPKKTKKIAIYGYLLLAINILPLAGIPAGLWALEKTAYFYWAECALVAIFAMAVYSRYLIVFFLLSLAMGLIVYTANAALLSNLSAILAFWFLYGFFWLIYIEIGKSAYYGQMIKRLAPQKQLTIYLTYMSLSLGLCFIVTSVIEKNWVPETNKLAFYETFVGIAILVPTISMGLLRVIDMIGQKHFIDFLMGTYHKPVEQTRIVLFLDMVGSSRIAENLEPRQSMKLIADFIYDCSYIFRIHGGDILNYTGDGLVVLWPEASANAALTAVKKLQAHFASKQARSDYWKKFGVVPEFRIGIHCGTIILSQIGEEKLFIGLYGDTVNVAARLEQMNKDLKTNILLSAEVAERAGSAWKPFLNPLGEKEIRGRREKISVYALEQESRQKQQTTAE